MILVLKPSLSAKGIKSLSDNGKVSNLSVYEDQKAINSDCILSIVIPTRRRPKAFAIVLKALLRFFEENPNPQVQIIISNNGDDLETKKTVHDMSLDFPNQNLVYLCPEMEFKTAEEHLIWLYSLNWGEFVWFLGDQDLPIESGVKNLIDKILLHQEMDFFVANFATERNNLILSKSYYGDLLRVDQEVNFQTAVIKFGYWAGICGISNQILRSQKLDSELFKRIAETTGTIYSHMTHHIGVFGQSKGLVLSDPLVEYHLNDLADGDSSSWQEYAKSKGRPYWDPWALSFLKQIHFLNENNFVNNDFLESVLDYEVGLIEIPQAVPLTTRIKFNLDSYFYYSNKAPSRQKYLDEELALIFKYCKKYIPRLHGHWNKLERQGMQSPPAHYTHGAFDQYLIKEAGQFAIYSFADTFYAIFELLKGKMSYAIPNPGYLCANHFITSDSLDDLMSKVERGIDIDSCTCSKAIYDKAPYARVPKWALKFLLPSYYRLPYNIRSYLRRIIMLWNKI